MPTSFGKQQPPAGSSLKCHKFSHSDVSFFCTSSPPGTSEPAPHNTNPPSGALLSLHSDPLTRGSVGSAGVGHAHSLEEWHHWPLTLASFHHIRMPSPGHPPPQFTPPLSITPFICSREERMKYISETRFSGKPVLLSVRWQVYLLIMESRDFTHPSVFFSRCLSLECRLRGLTHQPFSVFLFLKL